MVRRLLSVMLCIGLLAGCDGDSAESSTTTSGYATTTTAVPVAAEDAGHWWDGRVFYEIFVRSFRDSDGDGIGDFVGLAQSLDYLNDGDPTTTDDLGVTGIWLMPIFPSPSYHGYDVTDYTTVNPEYGTMEEFEAFLDAAHQRGINVIVDLVLNHTSVEHPWFEASAAGDAAYADWYLWSESDPATTGPWGQSVWHKGERGYYFGLFWEGMPDLNLENDAVRQELYEIARFWLEDVGVDGFRLDAARHLIEEGEVMADTPATVAWLQDFSEYVHEISPDALVLGEIWSPTLQIAKYVPNAVDLAFEFPLSEASASSVTNGDAAALEAAFERVAGAYPDGQFAPFLTNHDMDRTMSVAGGDVRIAKLAATWLLTSPGVPFVYYGEEVGLEGVKPDEQIRTPMPWTGEPPGLGFTTGDPWEPVDPGYPEHNVAAEAGDPASLLSLYRTLIQFRTESSALRTGDLIDIETGQSSVFAYLRSDGEDHVLVVGNVSAGQVPIELDLADGPLDGVRGAITVVGPGAVPPEITDRGGFLDYQPIDALPAFGTLVVQLTPDEQPLPPTTTTIAATDEDATIAAAVLVDVAGVSDLISGDFVLRVGGVDYGLNTEIGAEQVEDWDGDGGHTVADLLLMQAAMSTAFRWDLTADCAPVGDAVSCSAIERDLFSELAGIEPPATSYTVWVENGEVVRVEIGTPEQTADGLSAQNKWAEQFVLFERWLSTTYPERYSDLFTGSCCAGDGSNISFNPENAGDWEALLLEWAPVSE